MTVVKDLYTIQIVLEDGPYQELEPARMAATIAEAEENLTLLLPPCYRAVIRPWNAPPPDEEEHFHA